MFTSITDDVRYAWHSLRSTPWLVGVAVVILALAIGVNAGMFSVIDALLLKHLAIRNPSELVAISMTDPSGARRKLSVPITIALAERQQVFSGTIAWVGDLVVNVEAGGQLGLGNVWATTGNFHEELGQTPILGRLFDDKNFTLGSTAETDVAIIGHSFWERRYGADPRAIGSEIRIEGRPFTVIGVTQKWFTGMALGIAPDVTVLLAALPAINQALGLSRAIEDPGSFEVDMAGRIKAGATPAQAQAQLESFWSDVLFAAAPSGLTTQQRDEFLSVRVRVESAARGVGREDRSRLVAPLFPLLVLGAIVFIVACLHLAHVMVGRAANRRQLTAIRAALGATRSRLLRQAVIEGVIVSAIGAAVGLLFATWVSGVLTLLLQQNGVLPLFVDLSPDAYVVALAIACSVLAAIACSAGMTWINLRAEPMDVLQHHAPGRVASIGWTGKALVSVQVALSLVLMASTGALIQSLQRLELPNSGFEGADLSIARLYPRPGGYADIDDGAYYRELVSRLSAEPGIASVGLANYAPGGGFEDVRSVSARVPGADVSGPINADRSVVSPGFFGTMGIELVRGRDFAWRDDVTTGRIAIVSQNLAERLFASGDALGRYVQVGDDLQYEIVGIVRNARLFDLRKPPPFIVFLPWLQEPEYIHFATQLIVRSRGSGGTAPNAIRRTLDELGHEYAMWIRTLNETVNRGVARERLVFRVASVFAALAALLTAVGLYSVLSYTVARRTREIGLRRALGAQRYDVVVGTLYPGIVLVAVGILIGVPISLAAIRALGERFVGIEIDLTNIFASGAILSIVAGIAAYLPAKRASVIEPMTALRHE